MSAWISVKDQIPPEHEEVIAYAAKEDAPVFTASIISRKWVRSSSDRFSPIDDFYGDGEINVTHWMPLPEGPK